MATWQMEDDAGLAICPAGTVLTSLTHVSINMCLISPAFMSTPGMQGGTRGGMVGGAGCTGAGSPG